MTLIQSILNRQFAVAVGDFLLATNVGTGRTANILLRETLKGMLTSVKLNSNKEDYVKDSAYQIYAEVVQRAASEYIAILSDDIALSTDLAKRHTNLSNLYTVNQLLGTSVTIVVNGVVYGLDEVYPGLTITNNMPRLHNFKEELSKIESVYEDLTYREGSDPANVKVQGILRQLLELRFAVSVHYFTTDQSKAVADVLNRIESIFSSLMDDTYSAKPLYNRIQARKPS